MVRSAECTIFIFMKLGESKSPTNILSRKRDCFVKNVTAQSRFKVYLIYLPKQIFKRKFALDDAAMDILLKSKGGDECKHQRFACTRRTYKSV